MKIYVYIKLLKGESSSQVGIIHDFNSSQSSSSTKAPPVGITPTSDAIAIL